MALMQPYFFPYIGYFQLMAACDLFIVADDVQYIEQGWVNRNRILVNAAPAWLTIPVADAAHSVPIGRREYLLDHRLTKRIRGRIVGAYRRAPCIEQAMSVVDEALACSDANVATYNAHVLRTVARYLGITTPVTMASALPVSSATGATRVLQRCRQVGASSYVNAIGGLQLYTREDFAAEGVSLRFLRPFLPEYAQFGHVFVPALSIIDVMMFNEPASISAMLRHSGSQSSHEKRSATGLTGEARPSC
jgi:hypothetical protein